MDKVCGVPDVELSDRKKPPVHCKVNRDVKSDSVIIKLEIKRVRKEDNDTLGTVKDFRKYMCKANRGNNEGKKEVEVAGKEVFPQITYGITSYNIIYEHIIRKKVHRLHTRVCIYSFLICYANL